MMSIINAGNVAYVALVIALVTVIIGLVVVLSNKINLLDSMGQAQWDFSTSWATTLTTVGALLATILGTQQWTIDKETNIAAYTSLSLFFGFLVLLAPVIYLCTSSLHKVNTDKDVESKQLQGHVFGFLLSSLFTLWGVFGQLATIFPLLQVLIVPISCPSSSSTSSQSTCTPGQIPVNLQPIMPLFQVLLYIGIFLVFVYAIRSMYWITQTQVSKEAKESRRTHLARSQILYKAQTRNYMESLVASNKDDQFFKDENEQAEKVKKPTDLTPELPSWSLL